MTLRAWRPDLVHAHWIVPSGLVAAVARHLPGRRGFELTVHGIDVYGLHGRWYRALRDWIVRAADAVSPVSTDLARVLGLAGAEPVPMGVDGARVAAAVGERRPEPGTLLFVGRLVEKKGVDVLLRTLAKLDGVRLVVAGDGPELDALQRLAVELGVWGGVDFCGVLGKEALWRELRVATALVIASRVARNGDREGTPVVLAEAAAAGVPVIASAVGGLGERIVHGATGVLVPPDDAAALAEAVEDALADPGALAALGGRAQAELAPLHDIATTAERYRALYRAALERWWASFVWSGTLLEFPWVLVPGGLLGAGVAAALTMWRRAGEQTGGGEAVAGHAGGGPAVAPAGTRLDAFLLACPTALLLGLVAWASYTTYARTGLPAGIQGRYLFPGLAALLAVAAHGYGRLLGGRAGWLPPAVLAGAAAMQALAGYHNLVRYWDAGVAGYTESVRALLAWVPWPPALAVALAGAAAASWVVLLAWTALTARRSARD